MIWLATGALDVLLAIRFLLRVLGALIGAGFVQFIYSVTAPLVAPFQGIFNVGARGSDHLQPGRRGRGGDDLGVAGASGAPQVDRGSNPDSRRTTASASLQLVSMTEPVGVAER